MELSIAYCKWSDTLIWACTCQREVSGTSASPRTLHSVSDLS